MGMDFVEAKDDKASTELIGLEGDSDNQISGSAK